MASSHTGGVGQSNISRFYSGLWTREEKSSFCNLFCERKRNTMRVGWGRSVGVASQAFPGLPCLPSSFILTFSVPKACLESHLLAVSTGLGCVFFQEDISVPLWAGVPVKG